MSKEITVQPLMSPTIRNVQSDPNTSMNRLQALRKIYSLDTDASREHRDTVYESLSRYWGDQWQERIATQRRKDLRPTLSFNHVAPIVDSIVNKSAINPVTVKVKPTHRAWTREAELRQGVIRHEMLESRAKDAFYWAHLHQTIAGEGDFRLHIGSDIFGPTLEVVTIPDPLCVVWDRNSVEPTGSDAGHCFVKGMVDSDVMRSAYPNLHFTNTDANDDYGSDGSGFMSAWDPHLKDTVDDGKVNVIQYYERQKAYMYCFYAEQRAVFKTLDRDVAEQFAVTNPMVQVEVKEVPAVSETVFSGQHVLVDKKMWPITRVPVFRCLGKRLQTGGFRKTYGVSSVLKDVQDLLNLSITSHAERTTTSPRPKIMAEVNAIKGFEEQYRRSHQSSDPLLVYRNRKPEFTPPAPVETGFANMSGVFEHQMHMVSGTHPASLGIPGNETSGRAIEERQEGSDIGSYVYVERYHNAVMEMGKVMNELMPFAFSSREVIEIMGEDMEPNSYTPAELNLFDDRYHIVSDLGPSFQTRRAESSASLKQMLSTMPEVIAPCVDLVIEAQDWPGKERIVSRLRRSMPPELVPLEDFPEREREQVAQTRQQAQAQAQEQEQMTKAVAMAELRAKNAEALKAEHQATEAQARAQKAVAEAQAVLQNADSNTVKARAQMVSATNRGNDNGA